MSQHEREQLGEWLTAYLDGELNDDQRAVIERRLERDESARRLLEDLRRTAGFVRTLPRHSAPSSLAEDLQRHVERSELLSGLGERRAGHGRPARAVFALLSMAAVVALLVVGLRLMIGKQPSGPGDSEAVVALGPNGASNFREDRLGAGERGVGGSVPPPSERMAAAVSLRHKLEAGLGVASIRHHPFDDEAVHLDVTVGDQTECEAVTKRLLADLALRRVGDLEGVLRDQPDRAASMGSFYYAGVPMVNFTEPAERQVLVRATHRELDGLIGELAGGMSSDDDVALVAGPLSIHGAAPVQAALPYFEEPAPVTGAPPDGVRLATAARRREEYALPRPAGATDERDENVFDGLPRWVGVDPSLLTDVLESGSRSSPDRTMVPTESTPPESAPSTGNLGQGGVKPAAPTEGEAVTNRGIEPVHATDSIEKAAGREGVDDLTHGEAAPDRESGDAQGGKATLADIERGGKKDSAVPEEPPSLVARRAKALDEAKRRDGIPPYLASEADGKGGTHGPRDDATPTAVGKGPASPPPAPAYVTLVIRVKVADPNRTDKAATGRDPRVRQPGSPTKADGPKTESPDRSDK